MWLDPKDPNVDPTAPRAAEHTGHRREDPRSGRTLSGSTDPRGRQRRDHRGGRSAGKLHHRRPGPRPGCDGNGTADFQICGTFDGDGDPACDILEGFCTTADCVAAAQADLDVEGNDSAAVAVPFSAATDGRDHWLAAGEPHCADCHEAPYVEQSGNINAFAPFNYPRKASLMRYSRGHRTSAVRAATSRSTACIRWRRAGRPAASTTPATPRRRH